MTSNAWQILGNEGVSESLQNIMEGMNRIFTIGGRNQTYSKTLAVYATYRTRGLPHKEAVDDMVELARAGLL